MVGMELIKELLDSRFRELNSTLANVRIAVLGQAYGHLVQGKIPVVLHVVNVKPDGLLKRISY